MKYKVYSKKEWLKLLADNGYSLERDNGSHKIYKNCDGDTILFPKSFNPMIIRRTIKEHKLIEA